MNLKPLPLLASSLQRVTRSSWLLLLTFIVVQTGYAQQISISGRPKRGPLRLSAPSDPDNLLPTAANLFWTLSATNGLSDYFYNFTYTNLPSSCCSDGLTLRAAKNRFQSGTNWWETGVSYNGSFHRNVGPNVTEYMYCNLYSNGYDNYICAVWDCTGINDASNPFYGSTAPIFAPSGVTASDGIYDTQVTLSWAHETDIPHANHSYKIYRNNVNIATVSGTTLNYTDTGLSPGQSFTYGVTTYTTSFGTHESGQATDAGSTFTVGLDASDGGYYNRTKLSWNNFASICEEIKIERSI